MAVNRCKPTFKLVLHVRARQMAIGPADGVCVRMPELAGHKRQRHARLNQLTCVCVPKPMKHEIAWQAGSNNGCLEQVLVTSGPAPSAGHQEYQIVSGFAIAKAREVVHSGLRQKCVTRLSILRGFHIDASRFAADVTCAKSAQFRDSASRIQCAPH